MDPRTDAQLLTLARAGDDAAFGVLAGRHARALLGVAAAIVADPDAAEDVCQDALFRAWQRLGDCREPERVAAWLAAIVRRKAIDAQKAQTGQKAQTAQKAQEGVAAPGPGPDRQVERMESQAKLDAALAQLKPEQRQAVLLFDLEDWSHADIAQSLGTTEAMSRQHLMHGRRRLRELLALEAR